MAERTLVQAASDCEDVARGLQVFCVTLPDESTRITSLISKLYDISSLLRKLQSASEHPQYQPSFFRVKQDVLLVLMSLQATNRVAFDMFGRTRSMTASRVWSDTNHRMARDEGLSFHERLDMYRMLLLCCIAELKEQDRPERDAVYADVVELLEAQQSISGQLRGNKGFRNSDTPLSPSLQSDDAGPTFVLAPDPPSLSSPTDTSFSDQTYGSSQTSFSAMVGSGSAPTHWARDVFNGYYPGTPFHQGRESSELTRCEGALTPDALERLQEDGFTRALELQFEDGGAWIRFYHRASDGRARLLYITSKSLMHCVPLTQLKAIRDKSCLMLCRVFRNSKGLTHRLWACLNFATFERMTLFYSTFVAMKRQDKAEAMDEALFEDAELCEKERFSRTIKHGGMLHTLKIYEDRPSGVIRLEASPCRGLMVGVPLWTAFITTYKLKNDQHWAQYEGKGVVSLAALKPAPFVFLQGYQPPRSRDQEWLLPFKDTKDAKQFIDVWFSLCRRAD